jgi:hypothetical protein
MKGVAGFARTTARIGVVVFLYRETDLLGTAVGSRHQEVLS